MRKSLENISFERTDPINFFQSFLNFVLKFQKNTKGATLWKNTITTSRKCPKFLLILDHPSSNTTDVSTFLGKMLIENNGKKNKKDPGLAHLKISK